MPIKVQDNVRSLVNISFGSENVKTEIFLRLFIVLDIGSKIHDGFITAMKSTVHLPSEGK
jgi:hypothetical protein